MRAHTHIDSDTPLDTEPEYNCDDYFENHDPDIHREVLNLSSVDLLLSVEGEKPYITLNVCGQKMVDVKL